MFYEGQFYATDIRGKIYTCELGPNPKIIIAIEPPAQLYQTRQNYLVESAAGDFLMFCKNWDWIDDDDEYVEVEDYIAISFEVYKVDLGTREWRKLENLGDEALFIGCNGRITASASTGNSGTAFSRGNCIYIINNSIEVNPDDDFEFKHASIYELESRSTKRLRTSETSTS
ncbi:hypothetical protein P3X46_006592 [Hevea brasiliensis]|uniref:KIB1-4 beta-propeller domain-containing protein n=2 Tax=Hevea brasiliensis TaxID=3981 RepID=A0ABQ9MTZ7_HEVBR|nr:hypothetical protein P3X46_006592 [Hevea brasiliensis]